MGRAHVVVRSPQVEQLRVELSQQKQKAKSEQDRQLKKLQDRLTKTEVRECGALFVPDVLTYVWVYQKSNEELKSRLRLMEREFEASGP